MIDLKYRLKILFFAVCSLLLLWLLGFGLFIASLLNSQNLKHKVDAAIVFTGSPGRIEEGIKIFANSHAKKLLISGVFTEQGRQFCKSLYDKYQVADQDVILGGLSRNTYGNILESKIFMTINGYNSAYIITSDFHLPRSIFLLRQQMPQYKFYGIPIKKHSEETYIYYYTKVFIEYNKYLSAVVLRATELLEAKLLEKLARLLL